MSARLPATIFRLDAKVSVMQTTLPDDQARSADRYRTLWRWHFYAGLFVMPFLIVLALSGTLYCFQPQIEAVLYRDKLFVEPQASPRLSEEALLTRALTAAPRGTHAVSAYVVRDPNRSAEFVVRPPYGEDESVYVNPYDGTVLGTLSVEHRLMKQTRNIHRALLIGKPGELLMELAACWTLIMIATGVALWWPRLSSRSSSRLSPNLPSGAFVPDLSQKGRAWWRELHSVLGIWIALGALAFVLSGLPWTGSWGMQFKALTTRAGLGVPDAQLPPSSASLPLPGHEDHQKQGAMAGMSMPGMQMDALPLPATPWAVGATRVPEARSSAAGPLLTIDRIADIAAQAGVYGHYDIVVPTTPQGVYTVSYYPGDPRHERTMHIDPRSGEVLSDIGYPQYGRIAKWVSFGTDLHMGRFFGLANQVICSVISLGLAGMAISGCIMWWKRRPRGKLGAPRRVLSAPPMRAWVVGLGVLGVIFPLTGLSIVIVWLLDRLGARLFKRGTNGRLA